MNLADLNKVAQAMVAPGKGILARVDGEPAALGFVGSCVTED